MSESFPVRCQACHRFRARAQWSFVDDRCKFCSENRVGQPPVTSKHAEAIARRFCEDHEMEYVGYSWTVDGLLNVTGRARNPINQITVTGTVEL